MPFKYCHLVPVIQGILFTVTFITTYVIAAIINKDVPAIFPYISDTGVWSIERCIFSFMLGIGTLLMILTLYIRYRQVEEILVKNKDNFSPRLETINKISLYLVIVGGVGVFVLACFQVQPFIVIHLIGATLAFVFGWMSIAMQTYLSFKIYPLLGSRYLNIFRAVIILILGIALNLTGIFGLLSFLSFKGDDITQWTESSGGYQFHLVSVINEWILVLGVVFYLSLYAGEFKSVVLYKPNIELTEV